MGAAQTCPRRMSDWGPWKRDESLDRWESRPGLGGHASAGDSCSFCGSLHPDRFMELIRAGWVIGPTDKNYKAYLGKPRTEEEIAARKAQWLGSPNGVARAIRELGERDGKAAEQIAADLEEEWTARELPMFRDGCSQDAKFYYQHLSQEQREEFIRLCNEDNLTFGYPGYLYVLPFFCKAA